VLLLLVVLFVAVVVRLKGAVAAVALRRQRSRRTLSGLLLIVGDSSRNNELPQNRASCVMPEGAAQSTTSLSALPMETRATRLMSVPIHDDHVDMVCVLALP